MDQLADGILLEPDEAIELETIQVGYDRALNDGRIFELPGRQNLQQRENGRRDSQ